MAHARETTYARAHDVGEAYAALIIVDRIIARARAALAGRIHPPAPDVLRTLAHEVRMAAEGAQFAASMEHSHEGMRSTCQRIAEYLLHGDVDEATLGEHEEAIDRLDAVLTEQLHELELAANREVRALCEAGGRMYEDWNGRSIAACAVRVDAVQGGLVSVGAQDLPEWALAGQFNGHRASWYRRSSRDAGEPVDAGKFDREVLQDVRASRNLFGPDVFLRFDVDSDAFTHWYGQNLSAHIASLSASGHPSIRGGTLVVYYAGHGALGSGKWWLRNTPKFVDHELVAAPGVHPIQFLSDIVRGMPAERFRNVLIISDSCHSGWWILAAQGVLGAYSTKGVGLAILAAAQPSDSCVGEVLVPALFGRRVTWPAGDGGFFPLWWRSENYTGPWERAGPWDESACCHVA